MTIRRLDAFFRTQLTSDLPNAFNSATNFFLAPLQYVFGKNQYQNLKGKVTEVVKKTDPVATPTYDNLKKIAKVFMFFLAIILAPLGIVTRRLSLLSPDIDQAYSTAFLLQLPIFEQSDDLIFSAFGFLRKKSEEERNRLLLNPDFPFTQLFLSQTAHQSYTNGFLSSLDLVMRREFFVKLPWEVRSAFLCLGSNQAFALEHLQTLSESEFNSFMPTLPLDLVQLARKNRQKTEPRSDLPQPTTPSTQTQPKKSEQKVEPLDALLTRAINSLQALEQILRDGKDLPKKLQEYRNDPFYPFPFLLVEGYHEIASKADPALWTQMATLCQWCSATLTASYLKWDDQQLQNTSRRDAMSLITTTAKANIDTSLKDLNSEEGVAPSIEGQQTNPQYTHPLILGFWNKMKPNPKFLRQIAHHKSVLEEKMIPIEESPSDRSISRMLSLAMDQLENIANFEALVGHASPPAPLPSFSEAISGPKNNIHREQAQSSAPAPSLSSRARMSVAEELDSLLSEAFGMHVTTPDSESLVTTPSVVEQPAPLFELNFSDLQDLIIEIMGLPLIEQIDPLKSSPALEEGQISLIGKRVNECLQQLNRFFEKMLQQEKTLKSWVEENQEFFNCHPMAASHFLTLYLEKASLLTPHLDRVQLAAWQQNYPACVLMLRLNSLDRFIETEFPFDKSLKESAESLKKSHENPERVEELMKETNISPLPPLIFFRSLDRQLNAHPQEDRIAIDAWLQSEQSKPDYGHYFFHTKEIKDLPFAQDDPSGKELKTLYESCTARLKELGLGHYCDETLPPELVAKRKSQFTEHKDHHQKMIEGCLSVLRPLSEMLRQNSATPESTQRKTVEAWFSNFKANRNYEYPFFFVPMLLAQRPFIGDAFGEAQLQELEKLHGYCQDRMLALKLDAYLKEAPGKPSVEKRKLTFPERFTNENEFFKQLLLQDTNTLGAWLTENSPPHDYPLLWGKKRLSRLENYRESVDFALRGDWKKNFEACQARLTALGLQSHLNTDLVPANASRQLRVFINPQDPVLFMDFSTEPEDKYKALHQEIEASIQNPTIALTQHLRFYFDRYPQIIERMIPPDLLSRWNTAVGASGVSPTLPDDTTLQAAISFYLRFIRKHAEGTKSTVLWLEEQKADENYGFPFFLALYWQTLANPEDHSKLKTLTEFHKKAIDWAHRNDQKHWLLETPPGPQGVCLLVHRLTSHLLRPSFTAVIVKLLPRMEPLLAKKEMYSYWANSLTSRAKNMFSGWIEVYHDVQSIKTKREIREFLDTPKKHGKKTIDLLSKGNVQLVDQLAPILPQGLAVSWKQAYDDCCEFIRGHGIPDQDYIDVPASAFLADDKDEFQKGLEAQLKAVTSFFKALQTWKDHTVKSMIEKNLRENPLLTPFWFAEAIDDLLKGFDASINQKELNKFKETFKGIQEKLKRLKLEGFLAEQPPNLFF